MKRLSGKVALITGAGRKKGIGYACALRLAQEGASVAVADLAVNPKAEKYKEEYAADLEVVAAEVAACGVRSLAAVAFFASPDADYITGEVLDITGGSGTRKVFYLLA